MKNTIERNYRTVSELSDTKSDNKIAQYIQMAELFQEEAIKIAKKDDSFFSEMAMKEVMSACHKAKSGDCEYTVYINAHGAEVWLERMTMRLIELNS